MDMAINGTGPLPSIATENNNETANPNIDATATMDENDSRPPEGVFRPLRLPRNTIRRQNQTQAQTLVSPRIPRTPVIRTIPRVGNVRPVLNTLVQDYPFMLFEHQGNFRFFQPILYQLNQNTAYIQINPARPRPLAWLEERNLQLYTTQQSQLNAIFDNLRAEPLDTHLSLPPWLRPGLANRHVDAIPLIHLLPSDWFALNQNPNLPFITLVGYVYDINNQNMINILNGPTTNANAFFWNWTLIPPNNIQRLKQQIQQNQNQNLILQQILGALRRNILVALRDLLPIRTVRNALRNVTIRLLFYQAVFNLVLTIAVLTIYYFRVLVPHENRLAREQERTLQRVEDIISRGQTISNDSAEGNDKKKDEQNNDE